MGGEAARERTERCNGWAWWNHEQRMKMERRGGEEEKKRLKRLERGRREGEKAGTGEQKRKEEPMKEEGGSEK